MGVKKGDKRGPYGQKGKTKEELLETGDYDESTSATEPSSIQVDRLGICHVICRYTSSPTEWLNQPRYFRRESCPIIDFYYEGECAELRDARGREIDDQEAEEARKRLVSMRYGPAEEEDVRRPPSPSTEELLTKTPTELVNYIEGLRADRDNCRRGKKRKSPGGRVESLLGMLS